MALKSTYENAQDIPEGMESLYTEGDSGTFNITGIEGVVDKTRLDEFRDNNIKLRKEFEQEQENTLSVKNELDQQTSTIKELEERLSSIDMEEWDAFREEKAEINRKSQALADKELIESGEVNSLIDQRVQEVLAVKERELEDMMDEYNSKILNLEGDVKQYDQRLEDMLIDGEIVKFSSEYGVRSSALEDVLYRGRNVFGVEEGQAVAFDESGRKVYGEDAVTPLTISGWLDKLSESAPHLFEASSGAGAVQQVSQPTQVKKEPVSTHDMLLSGLANIGMK